MANAKGIAIIEITTAKESSKSFLLIHDPMRLLKNIYKEIAKIAQKNNYQYKKNPNSDYSPNWKSEERCQLAAYDFIKKAALLHSAPDKMSIEFIYYDDTKLLPAIISDEVKHNCLKHEKDGLPETIKRCDGGVFDLEAYINDIINYLKILSIKIIPFLTNQSNLHQAVSTEIQRNLDLADHYSNLSSSLQKRSAQNSISFDNWSELFPRHTTKVSANQNREFFKVTSKVGSNSTVVVPAQTNHLKLGYN